MEGSFPDFNIKVYIHYYSAQTGAQSALGRLSCLSGLIDPRTLEPQNKTLEPPISLNANHLT